MQRLVTSCECLGEEMRFAELMSALVSCLDLSGNVVGIRIPMPQTSVSVKDDTHVPMTGLSPAPVSSCSQFMRSCAFWSLSIKVSGHYKKNINYSLNVTSDFTHSALANMGILDLPLELRQQIYRIIFRPADNRTYLRTGGYNYDYAAAQTIFGVNRQLAIEAKHIYRQLNIFVILTTVMPCDWFPHYMNAVPITMDMPKYAHIPLHLGIRYKYGSPMQAQDMLFIHIDDFETFANVWIYACIMAPKLNPMEKMSMRILDGRKMRPKKVLTEEQQSQLDMPVHMWERIRESWVNDLEPELSTVLQRKLLLPLRQLKTVEIEEIDDSLADKAIIDQVKKDHAEPPARELSFYVESVKLKTRGAELVAAKDHAKALKIYERAFHMNEDASEPFQKPIMSTMRWKLFDRTHSDRESDFLFRVHLRNQLISNIVLCNNKLTDYDEAIKWAMIAIKDVREYRGVDIAYGASDAEDEADTGHVAQKELGKIYYRAALAYKAKDEMSDARKLLRVAILYLPNSHEVAAEMASCALQLRA